jgi:hypothetical protein
VPIMLCDARDGGSTTATLRSLIQHLLSAVPSPS